MSSGPFSINMSSGCQRKKELYGLSDSDSDLEEGEECLAADNQLVAPMPSAWVFDTDWRDKAYQEVTTFRNLHSCLIEQAYIDSYKEYYENNKLGTMALRRKKYLNLLGFSRQDIDFLSRKKCYKRVMGIKDILARRATGQRELPNWRDEIYDEIRSTRKMFSLELDDELRRVTGLLTEVTTTKMFSLELDDVLRRATGLPTEIRDQDIKECLSFLEESLNFLSTSRSDVVLLTKDYCRERLDGIKRFVENVDDCVQAKQLAKLLELAGQPHRQIIIRGAAKGSTNWRDLAYEQLQYKRDRFVYYVYRVYLANRITWSKIPEFRKDLEGLEKHLTSALGFYKMPRARMSTLETVDDYFKLVKKVSVDFLTCMRLIRHLLESLGKEGKPWRRVFLIPKRNGLSLSHINMSLDFDLYNCDSKLSAVEKARGYTKNSSSKRQRLDNGSIHAYEKLKSADFLNAMHRGRKRIKLLLTKLDLDSTHSGQLQPVLLDASFEDLLTSVKRTRDSDTAEKLRLVDLAKQILKGWEFTENLVGRLNPSFVSQFDINRSDNQLADPSTAWLLESDWRDMAYEEVTSIRNKHSCVMDQAYIGSYKEYYENNKLGSMALRRKKYLNLLGCSREDIDFLSKEKCYKRVMGIKDILARREEQDLDPLSLGATGQTQLPNWRDEIYDEIRSTRKGFSLKLDDVLRQVTGLPTERQDQDFKECVSFLEESLNFLSTSRSDVVLLTKDYCRERLDGIKRFVENVDDCVQAKQLAKLLESAGQSGRQIIIRAAANDSTNWRDLAFEQLQYKRDRFVYYVYGVYLANRITWSKIPEFRKDLEGLEKRLTSALGIYKMPRARMSTLETADDYFKLVNKVWGDYMSCQRVMKHLSASLGKEIKPWRRACLLPKSWRLLPSK